MLEDQGIGKIMRWEIFTGLDMNDEYCLSGTSRYVDNMQFLAFPREGLDIEKLEAFRSTMGDEWFDEIERNMVLNEK